MRNNRTGIADVDDAGRAEAGSQTIVSARGIVWEQDERIILRGVDWTVHRGEHWAVIGLNGSGKTSLMNMISGYRWPSKGTIELLGQRFGECDMRGMRKRIGLVTPLLDGMMHAGDAVRDIVVSGYYASIGLYEPVGDEVRKKADDAIEQLGLASLAGKSFGSLSQGERKKTLIARALMHKPQLLILDEPCSGLDVRAREQFLAQLQVLADASRDLAIVYVTHHVEELMPFLSHVLLMKDGAVYAAGPKNATIASELLSGAFDVPIEVTWFSGRPYAQVRTVR